MQKIFIQFIENLKPRYWQGTLTEEAIKCLMKKEIENGCNDVREYRYCYLCSLFLSSSDDMENLIVKENIIENSEREPLFVGADGPPYCLMRRLLKQNPGQYD